MLTIEELREESDRRYQEQSRTFQAWMDAEVDLQLAIEDENQNKKNRERTKRFLFFGIIGICLGILTAKLFG